MIGWNGGSNRMPRFGDGMALSAKQLNALSDGIERSNVDVDSSTGLQITETARGKIIGYTPQRVASYAVVSSGGIGAASGMTLGKGQIELCYKDDNGVLQLYGGPSDDCYNSTTATANKGDIIQAKWIDGDWAWDVASCP